MNEHKLKYTGTHMSWLCACLIYDSNRTGKPHLPPGDIYVILQFPFMIRYPTTRTSCVYVRNYHSKMLRCKFHIFPPCKDGANSFRRLPPHQKASSHHAIKTRRLVVCTTGYSFIHNHALRGHLLHHNLARWVRRLPDVVAFLPLPPDGAKYFRRCRGPWETK